MRETGRELVTLRIRDLLLERGKYAIQNCMDGFIESRLLTRSDRFAIITTESCVYKNVTRFRENGYFITGIFDLSSVYQPVTFVRFSLYTLSTMQPRIVKIGRYNLPLPCSRTNPRTETLTPMECLPDAYYSYCNEIEEWVNSEKKPVNSERYEFNIVNHKDFDYLHPYSHRYIKRVENAFKYLATEKTVPLGDLAEIIIPHKTGRTAKVIRERDFKYPFDPTMIVVDYATDTTVKYGDILVSMRGRVYLFNESDNSNTFSIRHGMRIIRVKHVSCEYLYLYLISDIAITITNALSSSNTCKMISTTSLASIPVIVPNKQTEIYQNAFKTISYGNCSIDSYYKQIDTLKSHENSLEGMFFDELRYYIVNAKDNAVKEFLLNDIKEIESCYRAKAYKAVLILTGSVLEGFLIDWLSELNGQDYFSNDYVVPDRRNHQVMKKADLIDYINAIRVIKKPKWMVEADHAHEIRTKRNLVHAKLCMSQTEEINDATSKKVISYLKEIIATRLGNCKLY